MLFRSSIPAGVDQDRGAQGPFVLVLVGATIVGSMATGWHGIINNPRAGKVCDWRYDDKSIGLKQDERERTVHQAPR